MAHAASDAGAAIEVNSALAGRAGLLEEMYYEGNWVPPRPIDTDVIRDLGSDAVNAMIAGQSN